MLMNWLRDEEGQAMVEYGLIIALIAIVVIAALIILGDELQKLFRNVATTIPDEIPAGGDNGGGNDVPN